MQKTKEKMDRHWTRRILPFIVLWTLSGVAVRMGINAFIASEYYRSMSVIQLNIIELCMNGIGWIIQIQLVQRLLKRSMRGWMVYNILGTLLMLLIGNLISSSAILEPDQLFPLLSFIYLGTPALIETTWLWTRVRKAWLWPLTGALIPLGYRLLYAVFPRVQPFPFVLLMQVVVHLIAGSLFYTLLQHPKNSEKAKVDFAEDEDTASHQTRIERLQERDHQTPLWDVGDDQMRQSEA